MVGFFLFCLFFVLILSDRERFILDHFYIIVIITDYIQSWNNKTRILELDGDH